MEVTLNVRLTSFSRYKITQPFGCLRSPRLSKNFLANFWWVSISFKTNGLHLWFKSYSFKSDIFKIVLKVIVEFSFIRLLFRKFWIKFFFTKILSLEKYWSTLIKNIDFQILHTLFYMNMKLYNIRKYIIKTCLNISI